MIPPNFARAAEPDALAAVLTAIPPAAAPGSGVIVNPQMTYLAALTVSVRPKFFAAVECIIERYIGEAKCPVRSDANGVRVYVFKNPQRTPFDRVSSSVALRPDYARVESQASFIALNAGTWGVSN